MSKFVVLTDFSFIFHVARSSALSAGPQYDLADTTYQKASIKLKTIRRELEKLSIRDYETIFVEDRRADRKLALHPGYRAGRADTHHEKDRLKQDFRENGVEGRFVHSPCNEADDTIATLTRLISANAGMFCVIVSGDKDLWQLISPTTVVFNPLSTKLEMVTPADIEKSFGVSPKQIPLHKSCYGDVGDCIPNAIPRTQRQVIPLIRQAEQGTLEELKFNIQSSWFGLTARCRELYEQGKEQIEINHQLVCLDSRCELIWE